MLDFKASFYEKVFHSMDNNAVLMHATKDGKYFPLWCSRDFAEMLEGKEEEFIEKWRKDSESPSVLTLCNNSFNL